MCPRLHGTTTNTQTPLVDKSWYFYAPNKAAPIFFAIAFAISGIVHAWQAM